MLAGDFLKNAFVEAYLKHYGRPCADCGTNLPPIAATNRPFHGILHAAGCMDLIPEIHSLYIRYVKDYETAFDNIAQRFQISAEELLTLIQTAALFHDSGREGDRGEDLWDEQSGDILYDFLITKHIPANLALFLREALVYKDNPKSFIETSAKITELNQLPSTTIDYIRQLVNMADTLEVIRVRDCFKYKYLPIMTQSTNPKLIDEVDELIKSVAKRINQESRTPCKQHTVQRVDGTTFKIQNKLGYDTKLHALAFDEKYSAIVQEKYQEILESRFSMSIIYTKDQINEQKFERLC